MLVSLTVGKVDAGVAVLLTEDKRLIEFPSILLPADITSGSIVDINVSRNFESEKQEAGKFATLQDHIYSTFGVDSPSAPVLRCRNATQTSVVLEWDPVHLATAELRSLSLYRNGSKAGNIPRDKLSTKISGLAIDTEYTFHLVLRTTAGTYQSDRLTVRTQKMTDLTGITITPGVMPQSLRDDLQQTVDRIGAKLIDTLRIDTTHFVCTEGRGQVWEKAGDMNVPVVVPDWLKGCEREGRIVGVRAYYLNADPKLRSIGPSQTQTSFSSAQQESSPSIQSQQSQSQQSQPQSQQQPQQQPQQQQQQQQQLRVNPPLNSPRIEHTPPTPDQPYQNGPSVSVPDSAPLPPPKDEDAPPPAPPKDEPLPEPEIASVPTAEPEPAPQKEAPVPAEEQTTEPTITEDKPTEEVTPPSENNLKAIGIPHEEEPSTKSPSEFDDVAL